MTNMNDLDLKWIWDEQKKKCHDYLVIKAKLDLFEHLNCYVATVRDTLTKAFIIEFMSEIKELPKPKRFKGVGYQLLPNAMATGARRIFQITLEDDSLEELFILFINDIVKNMLGTSTEEEALLSVYVTINSWRKLFDNVSQEGLSIELQMGLYSELKFMCFLLDNDISAETCVSAWTGPERKNQDFLFPNNVGIEIKSTQANHKVIHISNEFQLEAEFLEKLFLVFYQFSIVGGGSESLPILIGQLRNKIYLYNDTIKLFNEKLIRYGYFDYHSDYYADSYRFRDEKKFEVRENFPRITRDSIKSEAVKNVKYTIELEHCCEFEVSTGDFLETIKGYV